MNNSSLLRPSLKAQGYLRQQHVPGKSQKQKESQPQPTCTQALIKTACCFTLPRVVCWQAFRVQTDKRTLHLEPKPGKSSGLRPPRTYPSTPESRPQQPDKGSSSASSRLSVHAHWSLVSTNGTDVFICQSDPHQKLQSKRRGPYTVILSTPTAVTVQGLPHWVHCTRVKLTPKGTPSSKTLTVGNTLRVLVYNNLNKEKRSLKAQSQGARLLVPAACASKISEAGRKPAGRHLPLKIEKEAICVQGHERHESLRNCARLERLKRQNKYVQFNLGLDPRPINDIIRMTGEI
ncbi:uncharacterized protein LOC129060721 [Pongo abelii]|uniref:uncharacterized protein LOC129060721 n=1 Tax=Pongo abelii TaxID=9601 RepID=UPI0023E759FF|nr:uncharacterized protein LOC129060721 [Pongo abelii]